MPAAIRRIFIASTAQDLEPHRDAAAKAIEQLGHKPEYFERTWPAKNRPTLEACRMGAADADAVVVILAHRYGTVLSTADGGDGVKSITWHEVEAAKSVGKPVFAFLVHEHAPWTEKKERDRLSDPSEDPLAVASAVRSLAEFRKLLSKQPAGYFSTPDSLRAKVSAALAGWLMGGAGTATGGDLSDKRVVLCEQAVAVLLRRWRQGRDPEPGRRGATAAAPADRESVQAILEEVESSLALLEQQLWGVARRVHAGMAGDDGERVADITNDMLMEAVVALHPHPGSTAARRWAIRVIDAIKNRAGLLIERRFGVFTFPHRTFQEYLAARDLATREDLVMEVMRLRTAPNDLWRVPILMVGGAFAHLLKDAKRGLPVATELLDRAEAPNAERRVEDLVLAADFLCELTEAAVRGAEGGKAIADRAVEGLQHWMLDPGLGIRDRVRLGSALGRLDDPRDGVAEVANSVGGTRYPKFAWCPIGPGPFPMGNDEAHGGDFDERPRFTASIVQSYAISRYPVTVAQYRLFVEAGGYQPGACERYWESAWIEWLRANRITGPRIFDDVFQTPNHPQVGVSWYEATAFCRWLADVSGLPVRLPTETEWERAARHTDGREYPWGDGMSERDVMARANVQDSVGRTSAVGLYPNGAAECKALDMAGNVWEWCQTKSRDDYRQYPKQPTLDDERSRSVRVVRGGSWGFHLQGARCADRDVGHPDRRVANLGFRVCVCPFSHSGL